MQIVDVTATLENIVIFPASEMEEIIQNIKTILTTLQGSVPLDREFGIDPSVIDKPVNVIRPLMVKEIKEKIEQYEPRAKLVSIDWDGDGREGLMIPKVRVAIK